MGFRDVAVVAVVLIMLFSAVPLALSDGTDAVPTGNACDGVLIYEVASNFGSSNEGFSLKNYGTSAVDLNGYYLYDVDQSNQSASHKFTVTSELTITPGSVVAFVKTKNSDWFCEASATRTVLSFTEKSTKGGNFELNNKGDMLHLFGSDGTLVSLC